MRISLKLVILLLAAAIISFLAGNRGVNGVKAAGLVLSLAAFVPVFIVLIRNLDYGKPAKFLAVFVGGFFFKLLVVLAGIWYGIMRLNWNTIDFVVSTMAFLFALQIFESLFFHSRKKG